MMNKELAALLQDAIDNYNEEVLEEDLYLYWWDILNEIRDLTDDEEVLAIIIDIERETDRLSTIRCSGY